MTPGGGLLVVSGPPLGGKGLIASRLAECLPFAVKLEAVDNLAQEQEVWYPDGPMGRAVASPTRGMLAAAREIWNRRHPAESPVILLVGRFATPAARSSAHSAARVARMKFLLVEARSSNIRALQRMSALALGPAEIVTRLEVYDKILRGYEPLSQPETKTFPSLRLKRVLGDIDGAIGRVLRAWTAW